MRSNDRKVDGELLRLRSSNDLVLAFELVTPIASGVVASCFSKGF